MKRLVGLGVLPAISGTTALAIVILRWHHGTPPITGLAQTTVESNDPHALLTEANRLSWLFNWPKSGPLYQRAEALFTRAGDTRNALYARVGYIRSRAERMSFVDISSFLEDELKTPLVQNDPHLRLWCLVSKGNTDIEIDIAAARRDWEQAQQLAESLGEKGWANRANGELGMLAFLQGDEKRASHLMGKALITAMISGDIGAQIRYLELFGDGFNEINRQDEALYFFNRAIKLAHNTPDAGFPFMAYEGKAEALSTLNRKPEAATLLQDALAEAKAQSKLGHETQLLILLGELALKSGDSERAANYLEQAAQTGTKQQFYRMVAQAMLDLATLHREQGRLADAEGELAKGIVASRRVGDRYYLPRDLDALAELKTQTGHPADARVLYQEAEDVIDGMLAHTAGPYTESSLLSAMSAIYLGHFRLAVAEQDTAAAFGVVERARGRTLADMLRSHSAGSYETPGDRPLVNKVAALQVRLMRSEDPRERNELLESLLEAEQRLHYIRESANLTSRRLPTRTVPLRAIQETLRPDEALIEYVLAEPASFCLAVTNSYAAVTRLPEGRKQIEALVSSYLSNVEVQQATAEQERTLYSLLIAPLPEQVRNPRLIIIPDGQLHMLPFEALRDATHRQLIRSFVISYAPSGTFLYALRTSGQSRAAGA